MSDPLNDFLLHRAAWDNDFRRLESLLETGQEEVDRKDPRGRTPLHLAVSLGHIESARVLLRHKADVTKENAQGWTVLHEAVSTGDPEMVHLILQHRDFQQTSNTLGGVPELLQKISQTPDFYVEMKWEFTSWVPLVSRVCPADVCRIWKSGACLRVDITLLGFQNMSWERGRRSLVFRGEESGQWAELMEVNHEENVVWMERFELSREMGRLTLDDMTPRREEVERRLTSPVLNTALDTRNIAFERSETERSEVVDKYEAKIYTANNLNVVTRIRAEHLTQEEKRRYKADRSPFKSLAIDRLEPFRVLLGDHRAERRAQQDQTMESASTNNPTAITPEEYFDPSFDLNNRDIGRPKEVTVRTQKLKANLWMSEAFPLSLVEQVGPIVELMARSSPHFAQLRDFIALDFPGFPLKIEIPLFHVLNARITFGNVNACRGEEVAQNIPEGGLPPPPEASPFVVDPSVFEAPPTYRLQNNNEDNYNDDSRRSARQAMQDEDIEIMQFAIQQSLMETQLREESFDPDSNGAVAYSLSLQHQRALEESLHPVPGLIPRDPSSFERDLQLAMELSVREEQEAEQRWRQEEDAALQEALQLSLTEK